MIPQSKKPRHLIISIPHLPYKELSPNSREHYMVKARAVKASREEIGWLAKVQWKDDKPMMKARISYEFHTKDKRHRDLDNLVASMKSGPDSLIDVGVIFFDDSKHIEIGSIKVVLNNTEKTIIKVEELLK